MWMMEKQPGPWNPSKHHISIYGVNWPSWIGPLKYIYIYIIVPPWCRKTPASRTTECDPFPVTREQIFALQICSWYDNAEWKFNYIWLSERLTSLGIMGYPLWALLQTSNTIHSDVMLRGVSGDPQLFSRWSKDANLSDSCTPDCCRVSRLGQTGCTDRVITLFSILYRQHPGPWEKISLKKKVLQKKKCKIDHISKT